MHAQEGRRLETRKGDPQAPCPHSAAEWREMVPESAGERDSSAVQDHFSGGSQAGQRERPQQAYAPPSAYAFCLRRTFLDHFASCDFSLALNPKTSL